MSFLGEKTTQAQNFKALIERFEKKSIEPFSESDFKEADKELNKTYQRLMKAISKENPGETIETKKLPKTQRDWIKYRDAFVAFTTQKYPTLSSYIIKTLLTKTRITELEELEELQGLGN